MTAPQFQQRLHKFDFTLTLVPQIPIEVIDSVRCVVTIFDPLFRPTKLLACMEERDALRRDDDGRGESLHP